MEVVRVISGEWLLLCDNVYISEDNLRTNGSSQVPWSLSDLHGTAQKTVDVARHHKTMCRTNHPAVLDEDCRVAHDAEVS